MTEEQAKTKWCPMYRTNIEGFSNRDWEMDKSVVCCIASDCMWWVWDESSLSEDPEYKHGHCGASQ